MFLQSQLEERLVFLGLDSFDGTAEGSLTRFELCRLPFCTCLKRSGQNDRYYVPLSHFNAEDEEGEFLYRSRQGIDATPGTASLICDYASLSRSDCSCLSTRFAANQLRLHPISIASLFGCCFALLVSSD